MDHALAANQALCGDEWADGMAYSVWTRRDGFIRAGRRWYGTTIVRHDDLTPEQWRAVRADPMFRVTPLPNPAPIRDTDEQAQASRRQRLIDVIMAMDYGDGNITRDGRPTIEYIRSKTGVHYTAFERDEVWEALAIS